MYSSKQILRLAFLLLILVIAVAVSHKAKDENHEHNLHHDHPHKNHDQEKNDYVDDAKKIAGEGIHMVLKGLLMPAITFVMKWFVYIGIAGAVIWYFVTKRGAAAGVQQGGGTHQRATGHARSD